MILHTLILAALQPAPSPHVVTVVRYAAGPRWQAGKPPQEQALGGHFAFVQGLYDKGLLLANGLTADQRGLYVFDASPQAVRGLLARDPGVTGGVVKPVEVAPWTLVFANLGGAVPEGSSLFLLEYRPGKAWKKGLPITKQSLSHHLAYVGPAAVRGAILAGGPAGTMRGRYLLAAKDAVAAQAFVDADPGVKEGIFKVEIDPYAALHRQSPRPKG